MISVKRLLEGKKMSHIISLRPENTVIEALQVMSDKNVGAIMVLDGDRLVGIFSERDYARKGIIQGRKAKSTPLTDVMIHEVITVNPDMDIDDCMQLFINKYIRHLPVVENGNLVGILSIGDIVNAIIKEQMDHIKFLEQYITGG